MRNRNDKSGSRTNPITDEPAFYAHSANAEGHKHLLEEHLRATAELAGDFASSFASQLPAYYSGLWHDVGKFNPEFQNYLDGKAKRGPDHKGAGAKLASEHLEPLGLLAQGHHGGLQARKDFRGWLNEKGKTPTAQSAIETARRIIPDIDPPTRLKAPDWIKTRLDAEMWLRMVFSALVDADFIDTESHFSPGNTAIRPAAASIGRLWERFQTRHTEITQSSQSAGNVKEVRQEVYEACLTAARMPKGIFMLAVPTGGGKTLSSMAFALRHAEVHDMRRVITAVPFISITQQTAAAYRQALAEPEDPEGTVLEHHSQAEANEADEYDRNAVWSRLASENWDVPIVVTTTVQLFNSLFSNRTSAVRKLHNLANSVIILDEAQALPPQLLDPILDGLRQLAEHYGATIVLCTATQPAFQTIKPFADVKATDIVPSPENHFGKLRRVRYEWRIEADTTWEQAAETMKETEQALAIVNTKKDALALLEALGDEPALHLSTLLCGRHRAKVIDEIRSLLKTGKKCYVVSTQVVEAGVDLDFPSVLRAAGPLDSIIQAAGRCNRNGLLNEGRLVVFKPENEAMPRGTYRRATQRSILMLKENPDLDPDDPRTIEQYYRILYQDTDTDDKGIQKKRESGDYPRVAEEFRMIDDDTVTAIVTNYGTPEEQQAVTEAIREIRDGEANARSLARRVQPWTVAIYRSKAAEMERNGLIAPVKPGIYEWRGSYDQTTGIGGAKAADPDLLVV